MATSSLYYTGDTRIHKFNIFPWLLIIMVIAGIAYAVCSHAMEKHGSDALSVENCLHTRGALGTWIRPTDQHKIELCQTDDNKYGLNVEDKSGNNLTAFIYNAHGRVIQIITVLKYLHNVGYEPLDDAARLIELKAKIQ